MQRQPSAYGLADSVIDMFGTEPVSGSFFPKALHMHEDNQNSCCQALIDLELP